MAISRIDRLKGPCLLTYQGATFYSKGDVVVRPVRETFDIPTARFGPRTDTRDLARQFTVSFTPAGRVSQAILDALYANLARTPGSSISIGTKEVTQIRVTEAGEAAALDGGYIDLADDAGPVRFWSDYDDSSTPPATPGGGRLVEIDTSSQGVESLAETFRVAINADAKFSATRLGNIITVVSSTIGARTDPSGTLISGGVLAATVLTQGGGQGVDTPLVIQSVNDERLTLHHAIISSMPNLDIGLGRTVFEELQFIALPKDNTEITATESLYKYETGITYPGDSAFAVADILSEGATQSWGGSAPWDDFATAEGWKIAIDQSITPRRADGCGVIDYTLDSLTVTARAKPLGPTVAQIYTKLRLQGSGNALGVSFGAGENDLDIVTTGISARIYQAALAPGEFGYGLEDDVIREFAWQATTKIVAGVAQPPLLVALALP